MFLALQCIVCGEDRIKERTDKKKEKRVKERQKEGKRENEILL